MFIAGMFAVDGVRFSTGGESIWRQLNVYSQLNRLRGSVSVCIGSISHKLKHETSVKFEICCLQNGICIIRLAKAQRHIHIRSSTPIDDGTRTRHPSNHIM